MCETIEFQMTICGKQKFAILLKNVIKTRWLTEYFGIEHGQRKNKGNFNRKSEFIFT